MRRQPEISRSSSPTSAARAPTPSSRDLYILRRRIEEAGDHRPDQGFLYLSLSCRSLIYKGMFLAEQLTTFYPDLLDERFISSFAIYHQRYSTTPFRPGPGAALRCPP